MLTFENTHTVWTKFKPRIFTLCFQVWREMMCCINDRIFGVCLECISITSPIWKRLWMKIVSMSISRRITDINKQLCRRKDSLTESLIMAFWKEAKQNGVIGLHAWHWFPKVRATTKAHTFRHKYTIYSCAYIDRLNKIQEIWRYIMTIVLQYCLVHAVRHILLYAIFLTDDLRFKLSCFCNSHTYILMMIKMLDFFPVPTKCRSSLIRSIVFALLCEEIDGI